MWRRLKHLWDVKVKRQSNSVDEHDIVVLWKLDDVAAKKLKCFPGGNAEKIRLFVNHQLRCKKLRVASGTTNLYGGTGGKENYMIDLISADYEVLARGMC